MGRARLIILAGGKGTRLGNLTKEIPKPMVDIHGKPFLYWLIQHYLNQGFTDITISTGYKAEVIENHPWPWRLKFVRDLPNADKRGTIQLLVNQLGVYGWFVNGDTYVPMPLPPKDPINNTIFTHLGVDAGIQFITGYRSYLKAEASGVFFDIGTPERLREFRKYVKTYLLPKT